MNRSKVSSSVCLIATEILQMYVKSLVPVGASMAL